jgi:2-methylcitrate dehydratase PrpD
VDGQLGPAQVLGARLGSEAITALARRVEVRVSSELTRLYYLSEVNDPDGKDAAIVTVTLRDGSILSSGLTENVLYPEPGWGEAEIGEKFKWLAAGHVKTAAIDDLLSRLLDVATVPDVSALMSDLTSFLRPAE